MPPVKILHVLSYSSENSNFPTSNLLKPEGTAKWKSASKGEKTVSVTLQLERPVRIEQIDIGNEASAFVEVLVSRSSDDFQVLLVASSFISPLDARAEKNLNAVRIFEKVKLNQSIVNEKWDRVKVICSQPFNKNISYGLSFIKFHSPDDTLSSLENKPQKKFGKFGLKRDEDSDFKTGDDFSKNRQAIVQPSPASAIREATRQMHKNPVKEIDKAASNSERKLPAFLTNCGKASSATVACKLKPANNGQLSIDDSGDEIKKKKPRIESVDTAKKRNIALQKTNDSKQYKKIENSTSNSSSKHSKSDDVKSKPPTLKKAKSESAVACVGFSELMKGVVFTLSGFQNPYRSELRDRALKMGAKYEQNWKENCTHLVCAFSNTPKFAEVNGKGRIVKKEWIEQMFKKKKRLQWRLFRLGGSDSPDNTSGSDEQEYLSSSSHTEDRDYVPQAEHRQSSSSSSAGDTDDEIKRSLTKMAKKRLPKVAALASSDDDAYDVSTDEDDDNDDDDVDSELPFLPSFFAERKFFLYGSMSPKMRQDCCRYIQAYSGKLLPYMEREVDFVITQQSWDENFDDAIADHPEVAFLKPDWILECHKLQKRAPHHKFIIIPADD